MRLDRYLSQCLGLTRSESRRLAAAGRVAVDGAVCKKADCQINETSAQVRVDGKPLEGGYRKYLYLMLNKPAGVVSAARDRRDVTVVDLVRDVCPRRELSKQYLVTLDTPLTGAMTAGFAAGVTLADGQTLAPAEVGPAGPDPCVVRVVLHQGVYHQIKRMFGVFGAGVNGLHREAIINSASTATAATTQRMTGHFFHARIPAVSAPSAP